MRPLLSASSLLLLLLLLPTAGASTGAAPVTAALDVGPGPDLVALQTRDGITLRHPSAGGALELTAGGRLASFAVSGDRWFVGAVEPGSDREALALFTGTGLETGVRLPEPSVEGPLLMDPTLLADDGDPRWVLWLDGATADRMALRAARWNGAGWEESETISPPGPGTQIALDVAPTADGWLAVWAAYDGEDDEILWSRETSRGWTAPQTVEADDQVPDITPSLAVDAKGAVLAWSEYDGNDYRSRFARFDGSGWTAPTGPGRVGTTHPRLVVRDGGLFLVELGADPRLWWVNELAAVGAPIRRSAVEPKGLLQPRIESVDEEGVRLSWPTAGSERAEATGAWSAVAER